jgi:hypothetical protein
MTSQQRMPPFLLQACTPVLPHGELLWVVQGAETLRAELERQAAALEAMRLDITAGETRGAAEREAMSSRWEPCFSVTLFAAVCVHACMHACVVVTVAREQEACAGGCRVARQCSFQCPFAPASQAGRACRGAVICRCRAAPAAWRSCMRRS